MISSLFDGPILAGLFPEQVEMTYSFQEEIITFGGNQMGMNDPVSAELSQALDLEIGRAANTLELMLGQSLELLIREINLGLREFNPLDASENAEASEPFEPSELEAIGAVVIQDFTGEVPGRALLSFPGSTGLELAKTIAGKEHEQSEFHSDLRGVVIEVSNVTLNAVLAALSQITETKLNYSIPQLETKRSLRDFLQESDAFESSTENVLFSAEVTIQIENRAWPSRLVVLFQCDSEADHFSDALNLTVLSE